MEGFVSGIRGVFDNLNPFNTGNLILYFAWLFIYCFSLMAIWRSNSKLVRLSCWVLSQGFSVGFVLSYSLTVLLAVTYWKASIATVVATLVFGWWVFRTREPAPDQTTAPAPRVGPVFNRADQPSDRADKLSDHGNRPVRH